MKPWKAELSLVFITLVWGATFTFTKSALNDCQPFFYIFVRFSIALVITSLIWYGSLKKLSSEVFKKGLILGFFLGGGFILQTYGLKLTTVSKSAFITGMTMVFTPFVFMLVARKSVHFWHIAGVCVSTAGLWLFTNPDFNNLNLGDLITVVSTFFWAFYITYMDIFTKNVRDIAVTKQLVFMQFVVTVPIGFLFFILFELSNFYINITPVLLSSLFYNGIIASIILTLIHTSVQKYTTPVKAALIFALEPVFAASIAFFVISEKLSVLESAGAAILLSGVLVSEFGDFILGWLSGFFLRK